MRPVLVARVGRPRVSPQLAGLLQLLLQLRARGVSFAILILGRAVTTTGRPNMFLSRLDQGETGIVFNRTCGRGYADRVIVRLDIDIVGQPIRLRTLRFTLVIAGGDGFIIPQMNYLGRTASLFLREFRQTVGISSLQSTRQFSARCFRDSSPLLGVWI